MADPIIDVAHHARQPHAGLEARRDAQDLTAMTVAMRQQHERQHGSVGDLQDHGGRRGGELAEQRTVLRHDLFRLDDLGSACRRRLLDRMGEFLHEGQ